MIGIRASAFRLAASVVLLFAACAVTCAVPGCSRETGADRKSAPLSERQRDSVISKSRLPGALTVGAALDAADSAAARAARADSAARR